MLAKTLIAAVAALAVAAPPVGTVKEAETGVPFTREFQAPGAAADERAQVLLATGVREKFWIDVYAFGFYVDPVSAHQELDARLGHKSKLSLDDVERTNDKDIARTVRLVMVREIDAEDLREAFEDYLGERIETIRDRASRERGLGHLRTFRDYFAESVSDGTEMVFSWRPAGEHGSGQFITTIDGRHKGSLPAPELAWSLFDCYVGEDPISDDACEDMADELPGVLRAGERALAELREADAD